MEGPITVLKHPLLKVAGNTGVEGTVGSVSKYVDVGHLGHDKRLQDGTDR